MRAPIVAAATTLTALMLFACAPEEGAPYAQSNGSNSSATVSSTEPNTTNPESTIAAAALSGGYLVDDESFNLLSPYEQYRVANKLLATVYKGLPVDEYFDLDQGFNNPITMNDGTFFSDLIAQLNTPISDEELFEIDLVILGSEQVDSEGYPDIEADFDFSRDRPRELPLARISSYPVSKQGFEHWMAWHLTNSILFSPATEMDSTSMIDAQNIYRRLVNGISEDAPIATIVSAHMRSLENWRRFRSPEDNTREMMEIFLGLEDQDADVPKASKACQDLYLTDDRDGYLLAYTDFPNGEPQDVLNTTIVNCDDFYDAVAAHERLIPTVVFHLVNFFHAEHQFVAKQAIAARVLESQPVTFTDVFEQILLSKEYLLVTERPRAFEEAFLATAEKLRWRKRSDLFRGMSSGQGGSSKAYMSEMAWPAFSAKLGRQAGIGLDSLSFANYHKAYRELLLIDRSRWAKPMGFITLDSPEEEFDGETPTDAQLAEFERQVALNSQLKRLTIEDLLNYLFLSVVERKPVSGEVNHLLTLFDDSGYIRHEEERDYVQSGRMDDLAQLTMDYLSRLPETYYLKKDGGI
ncbi:MAG: hypothetical protein KTR35_12665 [Gammaproteobacteria bacterium]|nr:hypothetical protein [Gammaproteobacteria bacterium]